MIRTTAMFKCIITLNNGMHKVVRMTIDKVAEMCAALKMLRESPWLTARYERFFLDLGVKASSVSACKFINERTNDVLIEL